MCLRGAAAPAATRIHSAAPPLAPRPPPRDRVHAVEHDLRPNEVWVRARWHPLARGTLVLGTRYGHLLAFARAGTGLERRLSLHAAGSRATSFDSRNLADFAFGSAPGWDQLTAYLAFDDGPVAAVCPFAPRGCVLDAASMANLRAEATAVAAGAAEGAVKGVRSVRAKCKATRRDAQAVRAWLAQAWHREAGAGGREHWVFAPPREGSGLLTPRDFGPGQCVPVRMQPMRPLPQWHDYSGSDAPPTSVCAARSELGGAAPVVGLEASAAPVAGAQQQQQQQRDEGSSSPYAAGEGGDTHAIPAWPVLALLHADGVLVAAVVTRPPLPRWRANSQERLAGVADHELEPPAASLRGEFGDVRYDDTDDWVSGARRVCGVDRGAAAWWQELHKGGARAESVAADLGIVLCRGEGGEPYPRAGQSRAPWLTQDPEDPQLLLCSHVGGLSVVTLGDTERWCTEVVEEAEAEGGEEEAGPPVPPARVEVVPIIAPGLSAPRGASLARRTGPAAADSGHTLLVATRRGAIRCVSPWGALLRGHRASRVRAIDSAVQQAQRQGPDTVASTADGVEELTGDARSAADALALHKCDHTAFKAAVTELIGRLEAAKAAGTLKRGLAGRRGKEVADGDAAIGSEDEEEEGEEEEGEKDGEAATTALIKRFAGQVEGMSRRRVITLARLGDTLEARREMLRSRQEDIVRQVQRLREVARGGGGGELCTLQEEARQLNREMRRRAQAADGFLNVRWRGADQLWAGRLPHGTAGPRGPGHFSHARRAACSRRALPPLLRRGRCCAKWPSR